MFRGYALGRNEKRYCVCLSSYRRSVEPDDKARGRYKTQRRPEHFNCEPPDRQTTAKGVDAQVSFLNVSVIVGSAAWPFPPLLIVIVPHASLDPWETATDALVPNPDDNAKSSAFKVAPRFALGPLESRSRLLVMTQ